METSHGYALENTSWLVLLIGRTIHEVQQTALDLTWIKTLRHNLIWALYYTALVLLPDAPSQSPLGPATGTLLHYTNFKIPWAARSNSKSCTRFASSQRFTSASQRSLTILHKLACKGLRAGPGLHFCLPTLQNESAQGQVFDKMEGVGTWALHQLLQALALDQVLRALACKPRRHLCDQQMVTFGWKIRQSVPFIVMSPGINELSRFDSQPHVRTTSGREQRPTEKENYRRKEIRQAEKKVLKAAYQDHPDIFEQEPSELHSDIDMQEDMMFSDHSVETKLSNTNVLTFSNGKIPPRWCQISRSAHPPTPTDQNMKGPKAPPSNAHLNDALDDTPTLDTGNDDESESESDKDDDDTNS
ncbi:hypothetical protein DFH29DRAFT_878128 [Suillus ampliporus]|nr:hypothetical protein DFH29DRAFT_878128 [Suillus ampliporus]